MKLNVGSLNVRGLNNEHKRKQLNKLINRNRYDLFFCQEMYVTAEKLLKWEKEWNGKLYCSCGENNARGVGIYLPRKYVYNSELIHSSSNGRYVMVRTCVEGMDLLMVNVYAPNTDSPEFFENLFTLIEQTNVPNVIMGGDFNLVLNPNLDSYNRSGNNVRALKVVRDGMNRLQLCDPWRILHNEEKRYTCFKRNPGRASRIDFFLVSDSIMNCMASSVINSNTLHANINVKSTFSDHNIIEMYMEADPFIRGPGTWKLNVNVLSNEKLVCNIKKRIKEICSMQHMNVQHQWEYLKGEVQNIIREYTRNSTTQNHIKKEVLVNILVDLDAEKHDNLEQMDKILCTETTIKQQIKNLDEIETKGNVLRSRAKWVRDGEKNSKYFFSLEKRNYTKKIMRRLNVDGKVIMDQDKILQAQKEYYQDLYTDSSASEFKIENTSGITVNDSQKLMLAAPITVHECYDALMMMKNDKTPGSDGLPAEFYKIFWVDIRDILLKYYIFCHDTGMLGTTAREGIISLLPKGNKDPTLLKNWRPLTLLNLDYKILGKVLANRLKITLDTIIGPQQTGFMAGRQISDNIRKAIDVVTYAQEKKKKWLLMTIDFEKCFDKITYNGIFGSMTYFDIPLEFQTWVRLFFTQFSVRTQNCGYLSDKFIKTRSINQGCTISPFLYLLCGEILAHKLKSNENVKGICIENVYMLLSQFADDTFLYLDYNEISLNAVIDTLQYIETNTGLTISYDKTTVYRIGSLRNSNAKFITKKPLQWSDGDIPLLGAIIQNRVETNYEKEYDDVVNKMDETLSSWYVRTLTIMGKSTVVNTLIGSLFVYRMMVYPTISSNFAKKLHAKICRFLWPRKNMIKYDTLTNPKNKGGLKLVNLKVKDTSLKCRWVKTSLLDSDFSYIYTWVFPHLGRRIWDANLAPEDVDLYISQNNFWYYVLKAWASTHYRDKYSLNEIDNVMLWGNSLIRCGNVPIVNKKCIAAGLLYVGDLYTPRGQLMDYETLREHFGPCLSWLEHQQLIKALPKWDTLDVTTESMSVEMLLKKAKPVSLIYNYVIESAALENIFSYYTRFCHEISPIGVQSYLRLFKNLYYICKATKLRDFQYRCLLLKLPTNVILYKWGIKSSPECEYCAELQTLKHLFWDCVRVQRIWHMLEKKFDLPPLTFENVIQCDLQFMGHNLLILISKQWIYKTKCLNTTLHFRDILNEIYNMQKVELLNARICGKIDVVEKKWQKILGECAVTR